MIWREYEVELRFTSPFAASVPKNPEDIKQMVTARMPSKKPEGAPTTKELAEEVEEEVGAEEEAERGYATFKRDEEGYIVYEGRCVRAHIKDCANAIQGLLGIRALKSKVANRVYVEPRFIPLYDSETGERKTEPDGSEVRLVHAMTMRGPRSSVKTVDYVNEPTMRFTLRVLNDGLVSRELLEQIFEYGGEHGMGQERGAGDFGKYNLVKLEERR